MGKPLTLTLPPEVEATLGDLAARRGLSTAALATDIVSSFVADQEEFIRAVADGMADAEAGNLIDHEDVVAAIRRRRAAAA